MNLFKLSQNNRKLKNVSLLSFDEIEQTISNWNLPEIPYKEIYNFPSAFSLKTKPFIKTVEETISINDDFVEIKLLENELENIRNSGYKYLHLGLVQICLQPLNRQGLDTSVLAAVRDARQLKFYESLLGIVETSLCSGAVYFTCIPDFTVSITDINLADVLTLNISSVILI